MKRHEQFDADEHTLYWYMVDSGQHINQSAAQVLETYNTS